jgi:flavin-dependent dehydrogenase
VRRTDTLIVGGGPAGAAAAIRMADAGRRPLLIERSRDDQDALCGGFLSWTSLAALARLGIDEAALGAAPVEKMVLLSSTGRAETRLPSLAAAVSRQRLDRLLLERAAQAGARIERGVGARSLDDGRLMTSDSAVIDFNTLVLATGKHDLRGAARPLAEDGRMVGLRWALEPTPALRAMLAGAIELHLFRGGYAGLVLQEGGANLCLAVRRDRLAEAGGRPDALLRSLAAECPPLADRIGAAATIGRPQAIANMPYGWRARRTDPSVYRVGDQAGVIASLAGEGIGIALASGQAAGSAILQGLSAESFQTGLARRLRGPLAAAGGVARLAQSQTGARALIGLTNFAPALSRLAASRMRTAKA